MSNTVVSIATGQSPSKGKGWGGPARGYSYEPFTAGNTAAVTHGAYSARVIEPLAADVANTLLQQEPQLQDPLFRETVLDYARLIAQIERLTAYIDQRGGDIDTDGRVRSASELLLKVRKQAATVASRIGLSCTDEGRFIENLRGVTAIRPHACAQRLGRETPKAP